MKVWRGDNIRCRQPKTDDAGLTKRGAVQETQLPLEESDKDLGFARANVPVGIHLKDDALPSSLHPRTGEVGEDKRAKKDTSMLAPPFSSISFDVRIEKKKKTRVTSTQRRTETERERERINPENGDGRAAEDIYKGIKRLAKNS